MKIYQIQEHLKNRSERTFLHGEVSGLKRAAGGEDIVTLTEEAISSFRNEQLAKKREQYLINLAKMRIDDLKPGFEYELIDRELLAGEKIVLMAELVMRVAPSVKAEKVYDRITDLVIDQIAEQG